MVRAKNNWMDAQLSIYENSFSVDSVSERNCFSVDSACEKIVSTLTQLAQSKMFGKNLKKANKNAIFDYTVKNWNFELPTRKPSNRNKMNISPKIIF